VPTDVRYALRLFRRTPSFTATAVLTLALGIGVTTAIFTVIYGVLFRPLPITDGDRVAAIFSTTPSLQRWRDPVSGVRFDEWRARTPDVFADMAATNRKPFDLRLGKAVERVEGEIVSGNFFELLSRSIADSSTTRSSRSTTRR
jgi:putative ABC transport system permease protein